MAFGHLLACESLINSSCAIFTASRILGSCPVDTAKNASVTAIGISKV
jgi:hypothetical protein